MPSIISVSTVNPPHTLTQDVTTEFAKELFESDFQDIERLLKAFQNGQIEKRNFSVPITWFKEDHTLEEKNNLYIDRAVQYGAEAITACLTSRDFLHTSIDYSEVDAIIFISSTGMATPSIDARVMNVLPFSPNTKRIPLWGLGCAGGAAGLSRAYEYCRAYPEAKVLVLCIELCSLTFQRNDRTKSNLIGTSLFADGVACALVCGDQVEVQQYSQQKIPSIIGTHSCLMPQSEDVMGWDIKDEGLYVVFSRDIPNIIRNWLQPVIKEFLNEHELTLKDISYFVAHPGGKKVLEAYEDALGMGSEFTRYSREVLQANGNMSSPTVLYVLKEIMKLDHDTGEWGLLGALGPGFCSELLLLNWSD
ncbi:type III polyketide synthase [Alkalihalobacterium sp. APHAB7]|uniref:type III polyketide synthase n=1 Tax=Alkalihalobacterium sp. APHAB7 TaxID=3402081 RepID=UPI003AACF856